MADYGEEVLNQTTLLSGTWVYGGTEYDLKVEDIAGRDMRLIQEYQELAVRVAGADEDPSESELESLNEKAESLDDFSWEDEGDEDFIHSVIDAKLIRPDVDVDEHGQSKLRALFQGMMSTWQESDEVAEAKDEMPLDEGNG